MWGRFGQKKAICSHSLALKQRWELTSLQNRLGFLEAINLNLPVLEAHRVIDGRVDTAGSGIVDLAITALSSSCFAPRCSLAVEISDSFSPLVSVRSELASSRA